MDIVRQQPGAPLRLIRGGHVFAPADLGQHDVLIGGGKILAIDRDLSLPVGHLVEEIDASGLVVLPGLIDSHLHILGGGGEGGPEARNRDILLSSITGAGVTTCIGLIGVDCLTRTVETQLAKARALAIEGITAYILTGGYIYPTPTITGSVMRDIAFIEQVIGVGEIALSDHRSSQLTSSELAKLAAESRMGGLLGKKSGTLVLHFGNGPRALEPLRLLLSSTEIPPSQILPTHVNRNPWLLEQAVEYARTTGTVDVTAGISPAYGFEESTKPSTAVKQMLEAGVPIERVCLSSDANGNWPIFDARGELVRLDVQEVMRLYHEVRDLVREEGLPIETALRPVTDNVARVFHLRDKGAVAVGKDADLLLAERDLTLRAVYARGRLMVRDGQAVVFGTYERSS